MAKVLVIEDDAAMRGTICGLLAAHGHKAVEAVNGRDGIDALIRTRFDLVITDLFMPDQDGIEAIQRIRALNETAPIIAISGVVGTGDFSPLDDALAMGADMALKKPFTMDQILEAVDDLLDRGRTI